MGTMRDPWSRIVTSASFHCILPNVENHCRHHPHTSNWSILVKNFRKFVRDVTIQTEVTPVATMMRRMDHNSSIDFLVETHELADGYLHFCNKLHGSCPSKDKLFSKSHCITSCPAKKNESGTKVESIPLEILFDAATWDIVTEKFADDLKHFNFKYAPERPIFANISNASF